MGLRPGSTRQPKDEWSSGEGRRRRHDLPAPGRSSSAVDAAEIPAPQNSSGKVGRPRPCLAPHSLTDRTLHVKCDKEQDAQSHSPALSSMEPRPPNSLHATNHVFGRRPKSPEAPPFFVPRLRRHSPALIDWTTGPRPALALAHPPPCRCRPHSPTRGPRTHCRTLVARGGLGHREKLARWRGGRGITAMHWTSQRRERRWNSKSPEPCSPGYAVAVAVAVVAVACRERESHWGRAFAAGGCAASTGAGLVRPQIPVPQDRG